MLQKIYQRIIVKRVIRDGSKVDVIIPQILVEFPLDEKKIIEVGADEAKAG